MTLTADLLRRWFDQFNELYFGGELPVPRIGLSRARTKLGTMACRRVRRLKGWAYTDFTIRISVYYDCAERDYQQTLLHEMIHYYIAYRNIADTSAHGRVFRQIMNRLNSQYGWNITVSARRGSLTPSAQEHRGGQVYIVLALTLDDGSRMLSVVSRNYVRIVDSLARSTRRVADHRWYVSTDAYFAGFAKVRSLRACRVPADVYNEKTAAMQPLVLK